MNITQTIARCTEVLADEWLGSPESHTQAEIEINDHMLRLFVEYDLYDVVDALNKLCHSYRRTVLVDRLDMLNIAENMVALDSIEIDEDELQAMFDSGDAVPLTDEDAHKIIEASRK